MSQIKKYSRDKLEKRKTRYLGNLFIDYFSHNKNNPQELSLLESIIEILAQRGFDGRINIYRRIQSKMNCFVKTENYERAAIFRDMKNYFMIHILD